MRVSIVFLLLLIAGAAAAQTTDDRLRVTRVVIPVVGNIVGASGVRWRSDVELRNDQGSELNVAVTLLAPEERMMIVSLSPGQVLHYHDLVGELFGADSTLSPLIIQTEGRRSVTIHATAYGVRGSETFPPQPIAVNYGPAYYPIRVLDGLSFSDAYRTNIGLANLSGSSADFTLALQRLPGRNVAIRKITMPPNSLVHSAIQSLFPVITNGDNFSVVVETASTDTYVYASVIENSTNIANFVQPRVR